MKVCPDCDGTGWDCGGMTCHCSTMKDPVPVWVLILIAVAAILLLA